MEDLVKICFELDPSEWHGSYIESVWAECIPGGSYSTYVIRNTPFYMKGVSFLDVVRAEKKKEDNDGSLYFSEVIDRSGHSTYRVLVDPENREFFDFWKRLETLGCHYESATHNTTEGKRKLYAIDVPANANISKIRDLLKEGEDADIWLFEEGHVESS